MKRLILSIALLAACSMSLLAVPACPDPAIFTQPDGFTVTLCLYGDEFLHYTTTQDGYTVVRNGDGYYVYAQKQDGELVATAVVAHDPAGRDDAESGYLSAVEKYIRPDMTEAASAQRSDLKAMTARPKLHNYPTYDFSKLRGLVILVEFNDRSFTRDDALEVFTNMTMERNYAGVPSTSGSSVTAYTGSVRDYYYDNSMGTYDAYFDVVGPVTIDYSQYYAEGSTNGRVLAMAACTAADSLVNYADYDSDGDGVCDFVYFIYAGNGSNYTANDDRLIWPHAWTMTNFYLDGVQLYRYACSVELYSTSTSTLAGIGTMCHEYSHVLGLDDLYDTDYSESGGQSEHPSRWSLMAGGSYLNKGRTPPSYSLYERYALGFASPTVIESAGEYSISPIHESNAGYRINSAVDDEYFMLECRQITGWDAYLAGPGMLIFRVDSTDVDVWESNDVNVNPEHNYYELLRADPSATWSSSTTQASDPFPGTSNVTEISNSTTPSLKSWTGALTRFGLKNIALNNNVITFTAYVADIEDFESMPTTTADTTSVKGNLTKWDLVGSRVIECDSTTGNDSHSAAIYNGGYVKTTSLIQADSIASVTFYTWNPGTSSATLHFSISTDGNTWTELYEQDSSEATTLAAGGSAVGHTYTTAVGNTPIYLKISADVQESGCCTIDDIELGYKGTLISSIIGDGSADNPYLISDAEEWNTFSKTYIEEEANDMTGKYIRLTDDIDFTDSYMYAFGYDGTAFNGDLDGNSKTIKGISYTTTATYQGCIAHTTGTDANIHDITVEGTLTSSYKYAGSIVGKLCGTLSNVTSNMAVTGSASYTGGIAGYVASGATLSRCVNNGDVTSSGNYTAGITGYSATNVTYTGCGNTGDITYTGSTSSSYTAGLVSYCYYASLDSCFNTGTVTSGTNYASGLVAYCYNNTTNSSKPHDFTACYNTGNVTGNYYVAGIIGGGASYVTANMTGCYNTGDITSTSTSSSYYYTAGLSSFYYKGSTITGCYNTGNVTSSGTNYTGGLFAYYRGTFSSTASVSITGCYNTGNVTAAGKYAGGILGFQYKYATISGCYNTGAVTATENSGGITGWMNGSKYASITSCYNTGAVTATTQYAGGIVGYGSVKDNVTDCFNTGDITAPTGAGGIAGYGAQAFTNIYNTGTISGQTFIGGLIGETVAGNYTSVTSGYSTGKVVATSTPCGNIVGVATNNTSYWSSSNSMSNTFYLTVNAVDCTDSYSIACSYGELATTSMGDGWTIGDDYTYPRITSLADVDCAKAHAATVIPSDGDTYDSITKGFYVGLPDGVTWTASDDAIQINYEDGYATFATSCSGTVTMTATAGDVSVATELTCAVTTVGVDTPGSDGRTVVEQRFYTPAGTQVAEPADGQAKTLYIVVKTYDDGTTEAAVEVR